MLSKFFSYQAQRPIFLFLSSSNRKIFLCPDWCLRERRIPGCWQKWENPGKEAAPGKKTLLSYFFLHGSLPVYRHVIERDNVAIPHVHTHWNLEISLYFHATSAEDPWTPLCAQHSCILDSSVQFSSVSRVQLFATPWTAARQASRSITNSRSLFKFKSIESVMPSNHLILCRPLLLPPSIFPSIRAFSNESVLLIRWPKYWSFSFSISPSNEHSGLTSFRMDQLDHLVVSRVFSNTIVQKHQFFTLSFLYSSTLTSILDYWKNHSFD